MIKKNWIILVISALIILALLIIAGWLYIFRYEDCMLFNEDPSCEASCKFVNIITHNYCK